MNARFHPKPLVLLQIRRVRSSLRGPPTISNKVGQVGQVPFFIGFLTGFEVGQLDQLHSFLPYRRECEFPSQAARSYPNSKRAVESSRPTNRIKKSWPSWPSSFFHRLFDRLEVGQLHSCLPNRREGEVPSRAARSAPSSQRAVESSKPANRINKSWPSWPSSFFHRLFDGF